MIDINELMMKSEFDFEEWKLSFDSGLDFATYTDETGYGIKFKVNGVKYELFHNRIGMTRIFISEGEGHIRDIPFHGGTIALLPSCIEWKKL